MDGNDNAKMSVAKTNRLTANAEVVIFKVAPMAA